MYSAYSRGGIASQQANRVVSLSRVSGVKKAFLCQAGDWRVMSVALPRYHLQLDASLGHLQLVLLPWQDLQDRDA